MPDFDHLIVGAGFAGAVCARQLADAGRRVLLIDRRAGPGGNAADEVDAFGVRIHPHGPHIFHTNSERVLRYLSRFTDWRFYEHRVLAEVDGQLLPLPINRTTLNRLYGLQMDEAAAAAFLDRVREPRMPLRNSEDVVLDSVGADLCAKFFRGYTRKQWGLDLHELSAGVAARIPCRSNDDDRYFSDRWQFMPAAGYSALFARLLAHPLIEFRANTGFEAVRGLGLAPHLVYTGAIDDYFDRCLGALPYRSLRFEHQHLADVDQFQPSGTVNYPNTQAYTRITEFKHLTGQQVAGTSIVREFPQADGAPYYPIPRPENEALYQRYATLAQAEPRVSFVGRLAQYRYFNMDQVVAAALKLCDGLLAPAGSPH
jgi:UDP-galactopyranose mutase